MEICNKGYKFCAYLLVKCICHNYCIFLVNNFDNASGWGQSTLRHLGRCFRTGKRRCDLQNTVIYMHTWMHLYRSSHDYTTWSSFSLLNYEQNIIANLIGIGHQEQEMTGYWYQLRRIPYPVPLLMRQDVGLNQSVRCAVFILINYSICPLPNPIILRGDLESQTKSMCMF